MESWTALVTPNIAKDEWKAKGTLKTLGNKFCDTVDPYSGTCMNVIAPYS